MVYGNTMPKLIDLTGRVFGKLTVIKRSRNRPRYVYWTCKCSCGKILDIISNSLISKKTISCGCVKTKKLIKFSTTHNKSRSPEHICWLNIKSRCSNTKRNDYKYYGGIGIYVCDEWKNSFTQFYKDMGPRPSKYHTLDRIDGDKEYSKSNCRWVTRSIQAINTMKRKKGSSLFKGVFFHKKKINGYQQFN